MARGRQADWRLYAILLQMCQLLGVLPVAWTSVFTHAGIHPTHRKHHTLHKISYTTKKSKRVITAAQIITCTLFAFRLAPSMSDIESLTPSAALWLINWSSALSILLLSICSNLTLSSCLSSACHIYYLPSKHYKQLPIKLLLLMIFCPLVPFIYIIPYIGVLDFNLIKRFFMYNYSSIPVAGVQVVLSTFCIIAEGSYNNINKDLEQYINKRLEGQMFSRFTEFLEQYLTVAKFVSSVASYFSPHFFVIFLSFTFRSITYAVLVVRLRQVGNFNDLLACAVHSTYHTFCLISLCYRCHKVQEEASETRDIVRRLRVQWINHLSEDQSELTDIHEELMEAVAVKFTACGFFPVSLGQVLNVLGLSITYGFLAALQSN